MFTLLSNHAYAQNTVERVDGKDRFEVAVNLSQKGWPGQTDTVVLTYYNAFADALAASPLAYKNNAPILLTHSSQLTSITKKEITRLKPRQVIVVGGTGSISNNVLGELRGMGIPVVRRIGGKDRFEVAYQISKELPSNQTAVIAYGLNFSDALAIAPFAAKNGIPILLTRKDVLPSPTNQAIQTRNVKNTIVIGGEGSVGNAVFDQLRKIGSSRRIGGKDRYEVAANIIRQLNLPTQKAFMSTGLTFADALTGSVLAAKENAPILLTRPNALPNSIRAIIHERKISDYVILGGLASVQQKVVSQISGPLAGLTIVVDPGHGGHDPGAIGNKLVEKEIVLDVGTRLKNKLDDAGSYVIMTRYNDTYVSLENRVKKAEEVGANAFISIHVNSYNGTKPNGTETYWNSLHSSEDSKALANEIQKELVENLGTYNRGIKEANFYVIKHTTMPSVLVEIAFISNPNDARKLADSGFREKAAEAIYQGILNFYQKK
jgi:N-acetylmuramoyl-L-alanine amidase